MVVPNNSSLDDPLIAELKKSGYRFCHVPVTNLTTATSGALIIRNALSCIARNEREQADLWLCNLREVVRNSKTGIRAYMWSDRDAERVEGFSQAGDRMDIAIADLVSPVLFKQFYRGRSVDTTKLQQVHMLCKAVYYAESRIMPCEITAMTSQGMLSRRAGQNLRFEQLSRKQNHSDILNELLAGMDSLIGFADDHPEYFCGAQREYYYPKLTESMSMLYCLRDGATLSSQMDSLREAACSIAEVISGNYVPHFDTKSANVVIENGEMRLIDVERAVEQRINRAHLASFSLFGPEFNLTEEQRTSMLHRYAGMHKIATHEADCAALMYLSRHLHRLITGKSALRFPNQQYPVHLDIMSIHESFRVVADRLSKQYPALKAYADLSSERLLEYALQR